MSSKTAIIFPGQGSQQVGMGKDVAGACAESQAAFDQANEILGWDLAKICFDGPADRLEQTDVQQPAILVTSVALWRALLDSGFDPSCVVAMAGLSLGEYTALHAAGAVSFEDALRLVQRRGALMQDAALATPSGMVSLLGGEVDNVDALCHEAAGDDGVLQPANFNCPGQVVISGSRDACRRAVEMADKHGFRAISLPVAGAFHSSIMQPAADGLTAMLNSTAFQEPSVPVMRNTDAGVHENPSGIRDGLARQLTQPVLWQECIERMIGTGVERFIEVGPGRVLTALMKKINRRVDAVNVSSLDGIRKLESLEI